MQSLVQSGNIGNYGAVFTTYSQMQSVKGEETERRRFLRWVAPNSIVIMDESHEAGGSKKDKNREGSNAVPDRAKFARELLALSQGAVYSSATFAKRPDVMDLYSLTDLGQAVSTEKLVGIVERGGIPMQQGLATMLVEAGQYIRRERSYEGVSFDAKISPVNKEVAENMSSIMAAILEFDRIKKNAVKRIDKDLKSEAKSLSPDNSTGSAGVDSTNFTSIMHNLIDQSLLALKAEATVQECLVALRHNEKPVIALASTMGSFIGDYAELNALTPGDPINLSFGDLLQRYLERNREILVKDYAGNKTRHRLTDEELGAEGIAQYEAVLDRIDDTDLSTIPISPIDYIKHRLRQEGYRVEEITGRTKAIDYDSSGNTTYTQRQTSKTLDRNNIEAFNSGQIDVMLLNRSGATGISLHASERFADQRQRHMIVVQPEKDINNFMQMLGRIHRTGQVTLPKFTLLMADIPAEKRPAAVLLKKMASLNANTTAARKSGINLDSIPDFLNEYGSQVAADILSNNPDLNYRLASPLGSEDQVDIENLIGKVTGRIPLLPLAEQEAFYQRLEKEYQELVERQEAMGESILEANSLDLDAKTTARMEAIPANLGSNSPFTSAVYLEIVDAKTPRKPLTTLEVANVCRNSLGLEPIAEVTDYEFEKIGREARANVAVEVASLQRRVEEYQAAKKNSSSLTEKLGEKLDRQLSQVQGVLQDFPVGERVRIVTANQNVFYGVVGRVWDTGSDSGNPVVPANWRMQLLLADQARELVVPLSKVNTSKDNAINVMPQQQDMLTGEDVYDLFDLRQSQQRQERQIFTGNILRAYEAFNGKLVNFTDNQGKIRQGILTPQGFDIEKMLESEPVRMPTAADAKRLIAEATQRTGSVKTLDELLTIKAERKGDGFVLQTPKAKETGGQYYLDADILAAAGADFYSVGDRMECVVPKERIDAVLEVITQEKGLPLAAFDQRSKAREMLGIELPKLQKVELETYASEQPSFTPRRSPQLHSETEAISTQNTEELATVTAQTQNIQSVDDSLAHPSNPVALSSTVVETAIPSFSPVNTSESLPLGEKTTEKPEEISVDVVHAPLSSTETDTPSPINNLVSQPTQQLETQETQLSLFEIGENFAGSSKQESPDTVEAQLAQSSPQESTQIPETAIKEQKNFEQLNSILKLNQPSIPNSFSPTINQIKDSIRKTVIERGRVADPKKTCELIWEKVERAAKSEQKEIEKILSGFKTQEQREIFTQWVEQYKAALTQAQNLNGTSTPLEKENTIPFPSSNITHNSVDTQRKDNDESEQQHRTVDEPITGSDKSLRAETGTGLGEACQRLEQLGNQFGDELAKVDRHQQRADAAAERTVGRGRAVVERGRETLAFVTERREFVKNLANSVREIPLGEIAPQLGLELDRHDKNKWKSEQYVISINGQKFYDHLAQKGGYGAIDLVMHVQGRNFKEALDWLSNGASYVSPERSLQQKLEPKPFQLPVADESKWAAVRQYLTQTRQLPTVLVDELHRQGMVYADAKQNAVFVRKSVDGALTGASLRGTYNGSQFKGLATGSRRDNGWFSFVSGEGELKRIVLVESAIDAISAAALAKQSGKAMFVSTDGAGYLPYDWLRQQQQRGVRIMAAHDTDAAGEEMARKVMEALPDTIRARPKYGKDWNEQLAKTKLAESPEFNKQAFGLIEKKSSQDRSADRTTKPSQEQTADRTTKNQHEKLDYCQAGQSQHQNPAPGIRHR
jgi:hypothetical protein